MSPCHFAVDVAPGEKSLLSLTLLSKPPRIKWFRLIHYDENKTYIHIPVHRRHSSPQHGSYRRGSLRTRTSMKSISNFETLLLWAQTFISLKAYCVPGKAKLASVLVHTGRAGSWNIISYGPAGS